MKRFLIVDDNEDFLELLEELLSDEFDANVSVSSNSIEALELVQEEKYDLIMSDFMMPKLNGGELAKATRLKVGPNQGTPIILLTANVDAVPVDVRGLKAVSFFDKTYYLTNLTPYIKMTLSNK